MAATAEILEPRPALYALEECPPPRDFIDADSLPELRFKRRRAAEEAANIFKRNRQRLIEGGFGDVPLPMDALSTAERREKMHLLYGANSAEYLEADADLLLNCQRMVGEAYRKNTWEYFPKIFEPYDLSNEHHMSSHVPKIETAASGLSPVISQPEERDRRTNEYVEIATQDVIPRLQKLGRLGLGSDVSMIKVSECPDYAIAAYKNNLRNANPRHESYDGYAPENAKMMIRGSSFVKFGSYLEQAGISGIYITHEVIAAVLEEAEALPPGESISKAQLHAKDFLSPSGMRVLDFIKRLDQKASEISGKSIFMGEEVGADFEKDYEAVPQQAAVRAGEVEALIHELKDYIGLLQEKHVNPWAAAGFVESFIQRKMLAICEKKPELAAIIFDKATAEGFKAVGELRASGCFVEAAALASLVEASAPPVSFCGAGSCGLESVDMSSPGASKARELGLRGELIHDTERDCPSCGEKTVYYDSGGSKACTNCKKSEIKS